jgi:hypothetical protein
MLARVFHRTNRHTGRVEAPHRCRLIGIRKGTIDVEYRNRVDPYSPYRRDVKDFEGGFGGIPYGTVIIEASGE